MIYYIFIRVHTDHDIKIGGRCLKRVCSAKNHIPVTKRKKDKKWMTPEILDLMEERRKAKADIQKYRELDKQVKKRCNEAKEHWINTQCEEIEANNGVNRKIVHQKIKEVTGKKRQQKQGAYDQKMETF